MIAEPGRRPALTPSNPVARLASALFGLSLRGSRCSSCAWRWRGLFSLPGSPAGTAGSRCLSARRSCSRRTTSSIFGAEIPFPMPELVATMVSTAEIVLPILLAFGFLTRWAALGLLCMTGVIELTYSDGWANFICTWAAMALAIITFGPGAISLDRLIGLDGWSALRES